MRKANPVPLFFLVILTVNLALPQTAGVLNAGCGCADLLNELDAKIRENHSAYHIEIKGKRDKEYSENLSRLRLLAEKTPVQDCVKLLKQFLNYYKDGHLYIGQSPDLTENEKNVLKLKAEVIKRSEAELRSYFDKQARKLDPIEGIWFVKDGSRFAIFEDEGSKERDFVAVPLSGENANWDAGHVKAEFRKLSDGSYDVVYFDGNHFPLYPGAYKWGQQGGAAIRRGLILHIPPFSWGKEYPARKNLFNFIDPNDPRRPTIRIVDDSTILISIPSHVPEYASDLNEFVDTNQEAFANSDTLIIDLRGNEGGSSWITNVLMPYIETSSVNSPKYWVNDEEVVLSSPRNIRYFKGVESQGWLPKDLIKRLEEHPGELVPFNDPPKDAAVPPDVPDVMGMAKPRNVAVLIDDSIVSAGEAFIIRLMKSKKVTLFGENTAGVIDYRSTSGVSLASCPHLGIYLGYPMFAASKRLPAGGVNATGVEPDVRIDEEEKDPVRFIIDYFKSESAKKPER
ncbi:MAG TPA: S41 family peptidase [Aridibacter sp.]|nr:S41 family peptidase [Aridibacter sp.]